MSQDGVQGMSQGTTTPDRTAGQSQQTSPLLIVNDLTKHFVVKKNFLGRTPSVVHAVDNVSFAVGRGETLGIVGESGCGKSTTARLLMRLIEPDAGDIIFDGKTVGKPGGLSSAALYHRVQMVFQDSYASLNPRLPVGFSVAFGPMMQGQKRATALQKAATVLAQVGLDPAVYANRYAHELSGGQRQRVNIARALALEPRLLILDEAVSALDKSVEAQVLNLLVDIKQAYHLTYVFISHDLNVVRYISDRVMVMYLGQAIEIGPVEAIYSNPRHPYTRALLAAMPSMNPRVRTASAPLAGEPPNPIDPPSGCRFRTRCPFAEAVCTERVPLLQLGSGTVEARHLTACHMHNALSGHSRASQ
jgi:peptide/nickel transport system ATP-binding protein